MMMNKYFLYFYAFFFFLLQIFTIPKASIQLLIWGPAKVRYASGQILAFVGKTVHFT